MKQTEELYYHRYCTGQGFQKTISKRITCNQCGDVSSDYQFSFDSKHSFVEKYIENCVQSCGLDRSEINNDDLQDYGDAAKEIYDVLIDEVW